LIQAKGYSNRAITEEEKDFLKKYCKQKKVEYAVN